jgi:hypothetical protein
MLLGLLSMEKSTKPKRLPNLCYSLFVFSASVTPLVAFELSKNIGKTSKSSVPVLSAAKPKVFPGFFAFLANCVSYLLSTFYALLTDGPW